MKAHIRNEYVISESEIETILASIDFFLETTFDGVSQAKKSENDLLATQVRKKLSNKNKNFNAEEMRIIFVCLENLKLHIEKTDFSDQQDNKIKNVQLKNINTLQSFLESKFNSHGIYL